MGDAFETAMQDIAIRSADNGGLELSDILTALKAVNEDSENRHEETISTMQAHILQEDKRFEEWCSKHIIEYHPPHRKTDANGVDYRKVRTGVLSVAELSFRVKMIWAAGGVLMATVVSFLVNFGLDKWLQH
jgi:hypothetical protein